jgi:hypothetical protein
MTVIEIERLVPGGGWMRSRVKRMRIKMTTPQFLAVSSSRRCNGAVAGVWGGCE